VPQTHGLVQQVGGAVGLPEGEQLLRPRHRALEPAGVDLVGGHDQAVAPLAGLDRPRAQQLAQPHDAVLQHLRPRRRRPVAPEGVSQHLGADSLAPAHHQHRQDGALAGCQGVRLTVHAQRPEDRDRRHVRSVDAPSMLVNGLVTG
jgi:hypothetical protein